MKKRLLLVGNKPFLTNKSKEIDSFDYVVRVNRMNNYGMSGFKTDLLCTDLNQRFFDLVEEPFDKYRNAKRLLLNSQKYSLDNVSKALYLKIFKPKQIISAIRLNFNKFSLNYVDFYDGRSVNMPTNFFKTLAYLIENYNSEYDIYISGVDVEDRCIRINDTICKKFKNDLSIWHCNSLKYEEMMLTDMLSNDVIKFYDMQ